MKKTILELVEELGVSSSINHIEEQTNYYYHTLLQKKDIKILDGLFLIKLKMQVKSITLKKNGI